MGWRVWSVPAVDSGPLPALSDSAPPWLNALVIVLATIVTLVTVLAPIWGLRRKKPSDGAPTDPPEAPGSPPGQLPATSGDTALVRLAVALDRMEQEQDRDRVIAEQQRLHMEELQRDLAQARARVVDLEQALRDRDRQIEQLHRTLDRLLDRTSRTDPRLRWPGSSREA